MDPYITSGGLQELPYYIAYCLHSQDIQVVPNPQIRLRLGRWVGSRVAVRGCRARQAVARVSAWAGRRVWWTPADLAGAVLVWDVGSTYPPAARRRTRLSARIDLGDWPSRGSQWLSPGTMILSSTPGRPASASVGRYGPPGPRG